MKNVVKMATGVETQTQTLAPDQAADTLAPLLYDSSDLCHVLRCSMATLHRLKADNKLPKALRLGGQLRWSVEEVQAWIRAGMPDGRTWAAIRAAERGRA
jgi:predicted DNA-binding transcriptional regulator AlpA